MTLQLNFKTLDHRSFSLSVGESVELVEDLVTIIEDKLGRDNLYKLIHAGKLLREGERLRDHAVSSRVPIIVMVTKPPPHTDPHMPEECSGSDTSLDLGPASFKRIRTVTEDSGIEEDFLNDHFVTSSELDSVIEVILTCPYLIENDTGKDLTKDETFAHLDKYCSDNDAQEGFKDFMVDHLDKIMVSKLNKSQFHALLEDIQDIYDEPRRKIEATEESMQFDNDDIDDEEFQEIKSDKEAEESDTLSPTTSSQSKSLDFLRDIEEFQFLRYQVLHDPALLQPLLISFSQTHPTIMKTINENKEMFVRMLYEQTGAKLQGKH